jgi:ribosomal protein L4
VQATVFNLSGDQVETIELNDYIFGIKPNKAVMHQALVRQHANARQGKLAVVGPSLTGKKAPVMPARVAAGRLITGAARLSLGLNPAATRRICPAECAG